MISKSSYDTTIGNIFPVQKLQKQILEVLVTSDLKNANLGVMANNGINVVFVTGLHAEEEKIPPFVHPITIDNFKGQKYIVVDIRAYKNTINRYPTYKEFEENIKNKSDYLVLKSSAILEQYWNAEDPARLRARFKFAAQVYAAWVGQAVNRLFALDFHDQYRVMAIAVYFYYTRFVTTAKLEREELNIAVNHTIKVTGLSATEIYNIFEKIPELNNIDDFCKAVRELVENVRLANFTPESLLEAIKNTYFGNNAKDYIRIALEFPPIWIAIVFGVLTEKTFKSSPLYKVIETQAKKASVDEFTMNFMTLYKNVIAIETIDEIEFRDFEE